MRRILQITAAASLWAASATAQQEPPKAVVRLDEMRSQIEKLLVNPSIVGFGGAVMGAAVKNAPYSADEIRESTQVLGDGTRIHNESKVTVYRDSEGRIRRETPSEITIWDPAAGITYILDPKAMNGRKMEVHIAVRNGDAANGVSTWMYSSGNERGVAHAGSGEMMQRMFSYSTANPTAILTGGDDGPITLTAVTKPPVKESLGKQMMEGVSSEGERSTSTIDVGAIGNDRPISSVSERWYSPELQVNVMTLKSDPRTGQETFRLTNIHRAEPDASLFQVPAGYQILGPTKL
jgi:hypothetical protein